MFFLIDYKNSGLILIDFWRLRDKKLQPYHQKLAE